MTPWTPFWWDSNDQWGTIDDADTWAKVVRDIADARGLDIIATHTDLLDRAGVLDYHPGITASIGLRVEHIGRPGLRGWMEERGMLEAATEAVARLVTS